MLDERILMQLDVQARLHGLPPSVPVSTEVAALFLGYSASTLENMRREGKGPVYVQPSGEGSAKVKYQIRALLNWLHKNTVGSITAASIRDGKLFATIQDTVEVRPFWVDDFGQIGGMADQSTVSEAAELIETHDIVWLPVVDAVANYNWSDTVDHAMIAGRLTHVFSQTIESIAARVSSSELNDLIPDVPKATRKSIDD